MTSSLDYPVPLQNHSIVPVTTSTLWVSRQRLLAVIDLHIRVPNRHNLWSLELRRIAVRISKQKSEAKLSTKQWNIQTMMTHVLGFATG